MDICDDSELRRWSVAYFVCQQIDTDISQPVHSLADRILRYRSLGNSTSCKRTPGQQHVVDRDCATSYGQPIRGRDGVRFELELKRPSSDSNLDSYHISGTLPYHHTGLAAGMEPYDIRHRLIVKNQEYGEGKSMNNNDNTTLWKPVRAPARTLTREG